MDATQTYSSRVSEAVRVAMARKQVTRATLSEETGIKYTNLYRRLRGEVAFELDELDKVASALGVELTDLLPRRTEMAA